MPSHIDVEYGRAWGQCEHRWAFCGSHYNFKLKKDLVEFYGIINSHIIDRGFYIDDFGKRKHCVEYSGQITKNLNLISGYK